MVKIEEIILGQINQQIYSWSASKYGSVTNMHKIAICGNKDGPWECKILGTDCDKILWNVLPFFPVSRWMKYDLYWIVR